MFNDYIKYFFVVVVICVSTSGYGQSVNENGKAFKFDGVDDYIFCDTSLNQLNIPFTFLAWVYKDSSEMQPVFSSSDSSEIIGNNYSGFDIDISDGITFRYGNNSGDSITNFRGINNTAKVINDEWVHIAVSVFSKDSIISYIDGVDAGGSLFGALDTSNMLGVNKGISRIGKISVDTIGYFKGMIDDIRIWKYALSETEISKQRCTQLNGDEDSLVSWWNFNLVQNDSIFEAVTGNKSAIINPDSSNNLEYIIDILPNGDFLVKDKYFCDNDTNIKIFVGGKNVIWYSDSLFTDSITTGNFHIINDSLRFDSITDFTFFVKDSFPGCSVRQDTLSIKIRKSPQPPIVSDTSICFKDDFKLPFMFSDSNSIANWYLDINADSSIWIGDSINTDSIIDFTYPDSTSKILLLIENDSINGCSSYPDSAIIKIKKQPVLEASNQKICETDSLPTIEAIGEGVLKWYNDADTSFIGEGNKIEIQNYSLHANYFLVNDSLDGCLSDLEMVILTIDYTPQKPGISPPREDACEGEEKIILKAVNIDLSNGSVLSWKDSEETGLEYEVDASGTYEVKVENGNNPECFDTASVEVEFLDCSCEITIPNIFTPNGDGINEFLEADIKCEFLGTYELTIYNRWGKKVFQTEDKEIHWNGLKDNDGPICASGVYYYTLRFKNEKSDEKKPQKQSGPVYLHKDSN